MVLMGLDLSLTSTGISINGNTQAIVSKFKETKRLADIRDQLSLILVESGVQGVVVEGYAFAARNSQSHKIGELGGVIRLLLYEMMIPFVDVPPTSRAKFATGRGNAAKTEVISAVSARTGLIWSGKSADDECDAWLLEEMGLQAIGSGKYHWPENNMTALKNVDWSPIREGFVHGAS
jgi:crossover junction endodeoxyribonuclease RuvC